MPLVLIINFFLLRIVIRHSHAVKCWIRVSTLVTALEIFQPHASLLPTITVRNCNIFFFIFVSLYHTQSITYLQPQNTVVELFFNSSTFCFIDIDWCLRFKPSRTFELRLEALTRFACKENRQGFAQNRWPTTSVSTIIQAARWFCLAIARNSDFGNGEQVVVVGGRILHGYTCSNNTMIRENNAERKRF